MNLPFKVILREVVTRDGFQSLHKFIPTNVKMEIIEKIISAGVSEIESTSFVNPKFIFQLKDASYLVSMLPKKNVIYSVLVPNLKGGKKAIQFDIDKIVIVVSASESHNNANIKRSINQSLLQLNRLFNLRIGKKLSIVGSVAVAFGCPYEGSVDILDVLKMVEMYLLLGADSIILADTTGMATPNGVIKMVDSFTKFFPVELLTFHFHNNNGTAMANLLAALDSGVISYDTALGGIGGCPYVPMAYGNLPTEDVVYMLEGMNIHTGINFDCIINAASFLEKIVGYVLPGQVIKNKSTNIL